MEMNDDIAMEYETLMAQESLFVGAGNVASFMLVQKLLPKMSPLGQVFLAGVFFHLASEYSGLNEWYLSHGAAALYRTAMNPVAYVEENLNYKTDYRCGRSYTSLSEDSALSLCMKY